MSRGFVHLHSHSVHSLLAGTCTVEDLVSRAADLRQPALALTDLGVMAGVVEFDQACRDRGVKPIFGLGVSVRECRGRSSASTLRLLAETERGLEHLFELSSRGFLGGLREGRPTVSMEEIAERAEGLLALAGAPDSKLGELLARAEAESARTHVEELLDVFNDSLYLELQEAALHAPDPGAPGLVALASDLRLPLVATTGARFLGADGHEAACIYACHRAGRTLTDPPDELPGPGACLMSEEEIREIFALLPQAIDNTAEVAERCNVQLRAGRSSTRHWPDHGILGTVDDMRELRRRVDAGALTRFGSAPADAVRERLEHELSVIEERRLAAYFLILADLVGDARRLGTTVGPGRGSAGGSLLCYCLEITDVDPLEHGLLFERFLRSGTAGALADVDIDFSPRALAALVRGLERRLGSERVSRVATYGRLCARSAIRAVVGATGHRPELADRLAKLVPDPVMGRPPRLADCLATGEPLAAEAARDADAARVVALAEPLERLWSCVSVHACAVAVADRPLVELVPLRIVEVPNAVRARRIGLQRATQVGLRGVEKLGILNVDLLGLNALEQIDGTLQRVEHATGQRPEIRTLALGDRETWTLIADGNRTGIFGLDGERMRHCAERLRPTSVQELAALIALDRPGAVDHLGTYERNRRAPEGIRFLDPRLEPILTETFGVLIYQEQTMLIAQALAGFSPAESDALRSAVGKRQRDRMAAFRVRFISGAVASGTEPTAASTIWTELIERPGDWSFSKSHAISYARLAYWTAWLGAHYPFEFRDAGEALRQR